MSEHQLHLSRAERLSALADGELGASEAAEFAREAARDEALAERWLRYHQIGDALRSPDLFGVAHSGDNAFMSRLRSQLAAEPVVVMPQVAAQQKQAREAERNVADAATPWKWASGFAAVAAVAAVVWGVLPQIQGVKGSNGIELAAVKPSAKDLTAQPQVLQVVQTADGAVIRDARLDQYFSAHNRVGGAMSGPAAFVRNAAIESPAGK
jgi:sigma-E factor negative regulatory protein RseA